MLKTITLAGKLMERGWQDGRGDDARFDHVSGLTVDGFGNVWACDTWNHTIRKITPEGDVTTVAGVREEKGLKDGPAFEALFHFPFGIALDSSGDAFVADTYNHCIRRISGGVVSTVAGTKDCGYVDGSLEEARFNEPYNLVVDPLGVVYVTDKSNGFVRKIEKGRVTTFSDHFVDPTGIALDEQGNLYVIDTKPGILYKLGKDGQKEVVIGQQQTDGHRQVFDSPHGIALGRDGKIFISDTFSYIIRVLENGNLSTLNASCTRFGHPRGIAVDITGLYIADRTNCAVRKVLFPFSWSLRNHKRFPRGIKNPIKAVMMISRRSRFYGVPNDVLFIIFQMVADSIQPN